MNSAGPAAIQTLQQAVQEAVNRYVARNPRSAAAADDAARAMPGGNTRSSLFHRPFPLRMAQGAGCRLRDVDGHDYIDLLGEFTSGIAGHSPEPILTAIRDALADGINLSAHNMLEARLAAGLCARFPSIDLIRFANSGTEANLMALATARAFTGRHKVVVFENAYHGGLLAFGPGGLRVAVPHDYAILPYNDKDAAESYFARHGAEVAAVLVEPMLGAGGCVPGDPEFLSLLARLARHHEAILIFDEVQTSRLSAGGRQALLGMTPDMTTIGKYFGGGLAFGAFGGRADLMAQYDPRQAGALMHAGTFNNNTLAMAAGLAALEHVVTPDALDRINALGDAMRGSLNALFAEQGAPFHVTGLGSIMNIHPVPATGAEAGLLRDLIFFDLLERGFFIASRGLIALSVPIGPAEMSAFADAVRDILIARRGVLGQAVPSAPR
ncbi:aminotransferase class III-fold pyridoxal phosphate-dependent enzyme [Halodurantibacterium flavum]|uniref:Aminotransferase class III-fold pyridoxal phosphate-dependent enzyme n=1 Tax=Halodurantibacterium flavum TaxID=1382802 RepID=A0ABW4S1M6_9RHOB